MKLFGALASLLFLSMFPVPALASDTVAKTFCTQAISYESLDKLKTDLLTNAKRLAVNELFGELIAASTAVDNSVVTSDQVRTSSVGFVRLEGTIDYHNGVNFAEVCVTIRAYATAQDRDKFKPVKLTKRHCVTNPDLTTRQLTSFGKEEVIAQALLDYDRRLEKQDRKDLLRLMQKVYYSESGFIPDTETFCARVEGYIVPIEIIALLEIAVPTGFREEFNKSDLDASVWQVLGSPVQIRDGSIVLTSNSTVFSYIYSKQNPFPTQGGFALDISFRYPTVTEYGVGFAVDKLIPPWEYANPMGTGQSPILHVWQGSGYPLAIAFMGNKVFSASEIDNQQHVLQLRYENTGAYEIKLDGRLIHSSSTGNPRPFVIWLGNYVKVSRANEWTSLAIDSVRVIPEPHGSQSN